MQQVGKKGTTQGHLKSQGVFSCIQAETDVALPEPASLPKTDLNTTNSPGKQVVTYEEKKVAEKVLYQNKQLIQDKKKQSEEERKQKLQEEQSILKATQEEIEKQKQLQKAQKQIRQQEYENNKKMQDEKFKERFSGKKNPVSIPAPKEETADPKESLEVKEKYNDELKKQLEHESQKKKQMKQWH